MTLDRTWLLATARAEREALGRTIQYAPPHVWDHESVLSGWRNRDVVAHVAATDVAAAAVIAGEVPAELEEYLKAAGGDHIGVDEYNQWSVERRAGDPFRTVVTEWGRAASLLLSRASAIPPEEWATRRVTWVAGEMGVSYLIQSRVMEWWVHGEDIGAGADLPPRIEHPPIYCVNDLAVRTLPYALSIAGLSFPGKSVRVELEAAGGGSWHWGLAPRERPDPHRRPDAIIEGRGHSFARVAARRAPYEEFLFDGTLQTSGDDELAETVLRHLRAFAA